MTGREMERHTSTPGLVPASTFDEVLRRAETYAKSGLVPKALENNPAGVALVAMKGLELGFTLGYSIENIDVIEGRAVPNAQARLTLLRRAGHEARFVESSAERAVIRGRRREYRHDPDAWVVATYTIEDARRAELTALWVEKWQTSSNGKRYAEKYVVGDDRGVDDERVAAAPEWVKSEVAQGRIKSKDNWRKDPISMLRARAATHLCRMEFSDVMAGMDLFTADEQGVDVDGITVDPETGEVLDPTPTQASGEPERRNSPDADEDIVDAEAVEPEAVEPEVVEPEVVEPEVVEPEVVEPDPEGEQALEHEGEPGDPGMWPGDRWRLELHERKVTIVRALKTARAVADEYGLDRPNSLDDLPDVPPVARALHDRLDDLAEVEA